METIVILGNGAFPRKAYPLYLLDTADAVVCCDGALQKYLARYQGKRLPEAVVGDMDSLPKALQERFPDRVVRVSEQDDNDQTKAMRYVLEHHPEVTDIHIMGPPSPSLTPANSISEKAAASPSSRRTTP